MEEIKNPYLEKKRALLIAIDKTRDSAAKGKLQLELEAVELENRQYIEKKLEELGNRRYKLEEAVRTVRKEYDSDLKQYKRATELYYSIMKLVKENRQLKKELREEIKERRKRAKK